MEQRLLPVVISVKQKTRAAEGKNENSPRSVRLRGESTVFQCLVRSDADLGAAPVVGAVAYAWRQEGH